MQQGKTATTDSENPNIYKPQFSKTIPPPWQDSFVGRASWPQFTGACRYAICNTLEINELRNAHPQTPNKKPGSADPHFVKP